MNFYTNKKASLKILYGFLMLAFIFSGCKKMDSTPADISGLAVIQTSPTLQLYDLFIGTSKANQNNFNYLNKLYYITLYSGKGEFTLKAKSSPAVLLSGQITLKPSLGYTLFFVNKPEQLEYLFLEDDLTAPPAGKATIRFINTSWNAPALDLVVEGTSNHTFSDKEFKEYSNFEPVTAENVTLKLKNTATGEVLATFAELELASGKVYTIYARGVYGALSTDPFPLNTGIFEHK